VVVFDLDDTLYPEFSFLSSAYWYICENVDPSRKKELFQKVMSLYFGKEDIFIFLINNYPNLSRDAILKMYRNHKPTLTIYSDALQLLNKIKNRDITIGLITDGRSCTQRNKIEGLGLEEFMDDLIISEEVGASKPSEVLFKYFEEKYNVTCFYYIGDNIRKDFITPNKRGWETIGIKDRGFNIHSQDTKEVSAEYLPKFFIKSFNEIMIENE